MLTRGFGVDRGGGGGYLGRPMSQFLSVFVIFITNPGRTKTPKYML